MEATALSVGKSVLDGALGYAKSALAEEVALQLGIQRDHAFIRDELEMMRAFLMAAHEERDEHMVVKTWVKQVRDVAYDAEDTLQDLAIRLGKPSWWRLPRTLLDRRRVAARMKELRAKVEDVSQRNVRYRLIRGSGSKATTTGEMYSMVSTVMSGTEEAMRQRNKAKMDLIRLIHNKKEDDLRVIAIWGTKNVFGETSIVKRAYDDLKRDNKFECQAWISITHPFNRADFVQNIIRQFFVDFLHEATKTQEKSGPSAHDLRRMGMMKECDLIDAFPKYVKEKSFLIVLDDLSSNEEWVQIKECFPINKKGSRLVVCTEKVEVASLCVGKETEIPEHKQLFSDPILFAFYEKDSRDGTYSMEPGASSSADITTNENGSANEKTFTRMGTMISAFKESQLIGRMDEKSDILKLVLGNSSQEFQVISIYGMGGLGKTTLVKNVYQSQELCNMFEKRACVTVKRPFDLKELFNSLATQLTGGDRENSRDPKFVTSILEGMKYLVILDDLSSTAEWDAINHYFPRAEAGSRIIVTTRIQSIANHCSMKEENAYKLKTLGENDACNLFTEKVFGKITDLDAKFPELAEVAKLILKKCNGLPLAIVIIGGFLSNQPKTPMEWRNLNEHIGVGFEMNQELGAIKDILIKSYDGLPYHLKSCFLYMSIFPEDHNISRRRLVRRWIAEGYSHGVRNKSLKDMADNYFTELIDRSMILPFQKSVGCRNGIDSCHVHDLMREISISKSLEENLVFRVEEGCSLDTLGTTRHLSISSNWEGDESELESATDLSRIRSLTVFGRRPVLIYAKMRLLRVLDLEGTIDLSDHHLKEIGKLLHLKYLSLRDCSWIYHLPDSLGNLKQLQTLDVYNTGIVKLPQCIIKLRKLQYIRAAYIGIDIIARALGLDSNRPHNSCSCLAVLEIGCVAVPRGLRKLKALHTLGVVNIRIGKSILQEIKCLTQLCKLAVDGINKKNCEEFCSILVGLRCLESLSVMPDEDLHGCLDAVSSPPKSLQSLKLYRNLVKLPEWIGGLQNLLKLTLETTRLSEVDGTMQVLGKLPNLAILRLFGDSFKDEGCCLTFSREAPFPSLMVLELYDACGRDSVESEIKEGATPNYGRDSVESEFEDGATPNWSRDSVEFELEKRARATPNCGRDSVEYVFEEGATPKLELLVVGSKDHRDNTLFSGLESLPKLKEVKLDYFFSNACWESVQAQLAKNSNEPMLKRN